MYLQRIYTDNYPGGRWLLAGFSLEPGLAQQRAVMFHTVKRGVFSEAAVGSSHLVRAVAHFLVLIVQVRGFYSKVLV